MGGMGSGFYGRGGGKVAVEKCRSIDIRRWRREKALNFSSFVCSWTSYGETIASINVIPKERFLVLEYSWNGEPVRTEISYAETKTGFGSRKWFRCPACLRRCAVLYSKGKYFACRKCQNLNYSSSQASDEADYCHSQLQKLCKILKVEYDPLRSSPPNKPKRMHWKTYMKHARRYRMLAVKRDDWIFEAEKRILKL